MFVKIIYWEVEKDENKVVTKRDWKIEHVYDCNHASIFPSVPDGEKGIKDQKPKYRTEMNLVLEFNKDGPDGYERTITFPTESDTQVVDIFYMNNHGKTIERYVY